MSCDEIVTIKHTHQFCNSELNLKLKYLDNNNIIPISLFHLVFWQSTVCRCLHTVMGTGQKHVRPSISQQTSVTVATQASQYQAVYFTRGPLRQDTSLWQHTHQYFLFSNGNPSWHCNCSCSRNASSFQDLFYWGASQWWVDKFIWSKRDVSTVQAMGITALNACLLHI